MFRSKVAEEHNGTIYVHIFKSALWLKKYYNVMGSSNYCSNKKVFIRR